VLTPIALASAVIALTSAGIFYGSIRMRKRLTPRLLLVGGAMYVVFIVYLVVQG